MGSRWLAVLLAFSCAIGSARSEEATTKDAPRGDAPKGELPTVINVADLVKRVKDSVVVVSFAGREGKTEGVGTGFIIRADGLIATNNHVIGEARPITVRTAAGKSYPVESIVAHDGVSTSRSSRSSPKGCRLSNSATPTRSSRDSRSSRSAIPRGSSIAS